VCSFELTQRADEVDVLEDVQRVTGLGHLSPSRAQGNSHPQVDWRIASKLECRELVGLLRRFPLRGRKRSEFELWASAVERWSQTSHHRAAPPSFHDQMATAAQDLRSLRRYRPPRDRPFAGESDPDALRWFVGGFFSGEGCFELNQKAARVSVHLRADDRPLLDLFRLNSGLGTVNTRAYGGHPTATWLVCRHAELGRLVDFFRAAGLRGRKRREFEAWRIGAAEFAEASSQGRRRDPKLVEDAIRLLQNTRRYRSAHRPTSTAFGDTAPREVFIALLRQWAASVEGPLACTTYSRAQTEHPGWPTRNTIARCFGGWAAALRAAGLGARLTERSS
jgi:hypothetical protein